MPSMNDILTAAQNIVTAINGAASTYLSVQGISNVTGITSATVVKSVPGRICTLTVVVAGSGAGMVYDSNSTSVTSKPIFAVPATAGIYVLNFPALYGITIAPGTGQTISASYS